MRAISSSILAGLLAVPAAALLGGCQPWGSARRHAALCGKVTLMEYHRVQVAYRANHDRYAGGLDLLELDPPRECREDWRYDLKATEGGQGFLATARQLSTGQEFSVNEKGILHAPDDEP